MSCRLFRLLSIVALAAPAFAQQCFLGGGTFFDQSATCPENGRECTATGRIYLLSTWDSGSKRFLVVSTYTSLNLYNISDPRNPLATLEPGAYQPWQSSVPQADYDELQWDGAFLDGSAYGFAAFRRLGWVTFQVNGGGNPTSYTVLDRHNNGSWVNDSPKFARMFMALDGQPYIAGGWLDKQNPTLQVGRFNNGHPVKVADLPAAAWVEVAYGGSTPYLLLSSGVFSKKVDIYSMANPANPTLVASVPAAGSVTDAYFDKDSQRLYVLASRNAYVYNLQNPANPQLVASFAVGQIPFYYIAGSGDLVALSQFGAGLSPDVQVWSVANAASPTVVENLTLTPHQNEIAMDLAVFYHAASNEYVIYRAAFSVGTYSRISGGCLSTLPQANFGVSGGSAAASCGTATSPSVGVAARGFAGDTFSINDTSTGQGITARTLSVTRVGDGATVFSSSWSPTAGWNPALAWTPSPSESSGEYHVTLTVTDGSNPSALTKSIFLCSEKAFLTRTPSSTQLVLNQTLNLDASSSEGHPQSYSLLYWVPGQTPANNSPQVLAQSPTGSLPLTACGTYYVAAVTHYAHPGGDATCTNLNWYNDGNPNSYDACVEPVALSVSGAQVSFVAKQNGQATTAPLAAQDLTLEATVQGATATAYQWSSQPAVAVINGCQAATCTVPGGTLQAGTPYTITLTVSVSGVPQGCEPQPFQLTLTPATASAAFTVNPSSANVGQNVRLTLTNVTGSFLGMRFT
ncbi:MAG: hypothetical protein ACP5NF_11840, partial [Thermoanaerobaculum sp.]